MNTLRVHGRLGFVSNKKRDAGLDAFDGRRFVEFAERADFALNRDEVSVDCEKDVEFDCMASFHDAYVALAEAAAGGFIDLTEPTRTRRIYAGGHLIFVPAAEKHAGRVRARQLDWRDPAKPMSLPTPAAIQTFAVAPDGSRIAIAGGPQGAIGGDGSIPKYLKSSLKYSQACDWAVVVFDAATGLETMRCFGPRWVVGALGFSPDGATLAAGSADGHVYVWDVLTGRRRFKKNAHAKGAIALAWSTDAERLITGGAEGCVKVWNARSMAEMETHAVTETPRTASLAAHGGTLPGIGGGYRLVDRKEIEAS